MRIIDASSSRADCRYGYVARSPPETSGWEGTNVFIRDGERIFRTYFIHHRGDEAMGSTWAYLDIAALGRQEESEDSQEGYALTPPYRCWNYHDA